MAVRPHPLHPGKDRQLYRSAQPLPHHRPALLPVQHPFPAALVPRKPAGGSREDGSLRHDALPLHPPSRRRLAHRYHHGRDFDAHRSEPPRLFGAAARAGGTGCGEFSAPGRAGDDRRPAPLRCRGGTRPGRRPAGCDRRPRHPVRALRRRRRARPAGPQFRHLGDFNGQNSPRQPREARSGGGHHGRIRRPSGILQSRPHVDRVRRP